MIGRPARPEYAPERLDLPDHLPADYERSIDRVAAANRWLGGHRALWGALAPKLPASGVVRLLDAGTGSAEIPRFLARRLRRRRLRPLITAIDLHAHAVRVARQRTREEPGVDVARADIRALPFHDRSFDFAVLTLTLHHLDEPDATLALRELARVTRRALFVNELERAWPHYAGARLLSATIWRTDEITRHDGPISVLRGYTGAELLERARAAGLSEARVERRFFYRLILTGTPHA